LNIVELVTARFKERGRSQCLCVVDRPPGGA
jgi:hypothetical protein